MTENVQIALIVGGVFVVALLMFKDRISEFSFKASKKKGIGANMKGYQESGVNVSGNVQSGKRNDISSGANAVVENNQQLGEDNKINANKNN